ncbi:MAG: TIGR00282 family metallophosphoesterase, partial [Patescibacteria group bacterium]
KIIFLADIVGKIGRKAVDKYLPMLVKQYQPDLVIANAENLAHGIGFTQKTLDEMRDAGVTLFTSGNHAWAKGKADEVLNQTDPVIIRPANYPQKKSGQGMKILANSDSKSLASKIGQKKLVVVNLQGRVFMKEKVACPFKTLERLVKDHPKDIILVDFHAEATSEKTALAEYFDGRVSAVIGTHTHVPTADERILDKGTAYITDAGMVGYYHSIIGAAKEQIFNLFLDTGKSSQKHDLPETGEVQFNGIYLEINPKTRKANKIKRLEKIIKI